MPDLSSSTWSETDASNDAPPPNGWPEGQSPSSVNDCARMMMGAMKRFWDRINGTSTAGGTGNAPTLTYAVAPAAYAVGEAYSFKATAANTGAATLNVNGLGPKSICKPGPAGPTPLTGGEIQAGQIVTAVYDGAQFMMTSPVAAAVAALGVANTFTADQTIQSSDAGAGGGPILALDRASASPAASDVIGQLRYQGRDSGGNTEIFATLTAVIDDPTNGSEDSHLNLDTYVAGTRATRVAVGAGLYSPGTSGGDKGVNTANFSQIYEAGSRVMTKADMLAPKAWGKIAQSAGTYSVAAGQNVGAVTKNGTGDITFSLSTAFASADYSVQFTTMNATGVLSCRVISQIASQVRVQIVDPAGTLTDPTAVFFEAVGPQ